MIELKFSSTATKTPEEQATEIRAQSIAWAGHLLQFGITRKDGKLVGEGSAPAPQTVHPHPDPGPAQPQAAVVKEAVAVVAQAQASEPRRRGRPPTAAVEAQAAIAQKAEPVAVEPAKPAVAEELAETTPPSYEDVKLAFQKVFESKDIDFAINLLKEWNAVDPKNPTKPPNTKNLKPEQFADFIAACDEATA